jgi:hypothetical protein
MRAKILKVEEYRSNQGGTFFYVFFKSEMGENLKTCLYPSFRNFKNWEFILNRAKENPWLEGLFLSSRNSHLIDADSFPKIISPINTPELIRKQPAIIQQSLFPNHAKIGTG